jgi:hypothetical protein
MLSSMADETIDKTMENRLRHAARRQGFTLVKSRRRDRLATDWGWFVMQGRRRLAHFRDLDAAEHWLLNPSARGEVSR